ncbi:coiled-coil domain-containing protein [Spiroplasma endosymbiont of Nomada rufipes]|uniref:coiled-coil domain-containing protein n=2 Tax=Spiroplasma endosymbiont of Nomada rufipes TaxID=3077933 RepID=UPI00376EA11E
MEILIKEEEKNKIHLINCQILQEQLKEINEKLDNCQSNEKNDNSQCCETINKKMDQLLNYNNDKSMKEIEKLNKNIEEKNKQIKELEAKINNNTNSQEIKDKLSELENNKNNLIKEKEQFVKDADYDKATKIDKEIKDLEQKQKDLEKELLENNKKELEKKELQEKIIKIQSELEQIKKEKIDLEEKINNNNNNNICSKEEVIGEFTITKVTTIEEFNSTNSIREMIANKIKNLYPSAVINEDYKIEFENLNTNDIVQGKESKIKIKPTKNSKVKEELNFIVKINYKYDAEEQKRAATGILRKAIPTEFWNDRKNNKYLAIWRAEGRYAAVASMIQNVRPLPILLSEPHFASKIIVETFAASYWTNYHTQFWGLWVNADNGYWP